jgi:hypothetical protein
MENITWATPSDGGTQPPEIKGDPRQPVDHDINKDKLIDAIVTRNVNHYNEICVKDYSVIGIFMHGNVQISLDQPEGIKNYSNAEIVEALPNQKFYNFIGGKLNEVIYCKESKRFTLTGISKNCGDLYK